MAVSELALSASDILSVTTNSPFIEEQYTTSPCDEGSEWNGARLVVHVILRYASCQGMLFSGYIVASVNKSAEMPQMNLSGTTPSLGIIPTERIKIGNQKWAPIPNVGRLYKSLDAGLLHLG